MRYWQIATIALLILGMLGACGAPAAPTVAPTSAATEAVTSDASTPTTSEAATVAPATEESSAATRTRLVAATDETPHVLDAHQSPGTGSLVLNMEQMGQALMRIDSATGELIPDLAESWSFSEDGTILTITLPEGALFSNGDPLDAEAVKDSWLRFKEISPFGSSLEGFIDARVIDATTLEATFSAPPASVFAVIDSSYGGPWNVALAREVGNEAFALNPIASGPLALASFRPGGDILLVRNENYQTNLPFVENRGPLHLTELELRSIPEATTLAGELELGTVDLVVGVPGSAIERLRTNPDIVLHESAIPGYIGLVMTYEHPLFRDVRVRQALAHAIDREALVRVLGPIAAPQYTFINEAMVAYSAEADAYAQQQFAYDVAASKTILAELGWADSDGDGIVEKDGQPFSVEILVDVWPTASLAAQVLQSQLKEVGIDLRIAAVQESMAVREALVTGEFDLAFEGIPWRDPDIFIFAFSAAFWNHSKYDNPLSVEKMLAARNILDIAERSAAYAELQKIWVDDVVQIPLWQNRRFTANRTWVKGLIVDPITGQIFLNDVTIEETP